MKLPDDDWAFDDEVTRFGNNTPSKLHKVQKKRSYLPPPVLIVEDEPIPNSCSFCWRIDCTFCDTSKSVSGEVPREE